VEKMLAGHVEQTAQRCQAHAEVIVAQDTTDVKYTTHKGALGLEQLIAMRPHGGCCCIRRWP
jgi:hypothetical protein